MSEGDVRDRACGAEEDRTVICRCEDVTLGEIRRLISGGARTLDEIKRLTRAGMGLCQGRTCRHLILQEVSRLTGVPLEELAVPAFRPPTRPVKLGVLAAAARAAGHGDGDGARGPGGARGGEGGEPRG